MRRFQETDDAVIVELYHQRDESAITATMKKYSSFIFSVCNCILRQKQDSEECVNTVYKKLWDSIPPAYPSDLKAYVARIARTTAIDRKRENIRAKRNIEVTDSLNDFADILTSDDSVEDAVLANELAGFLNGFLKKLPERDRVCFVNRYYFNHTVDEIVKQTRIPRSTVYTILERVKNELITQLTKEGLL